MAQEWRGSADFDRDKKAPFPKKQWDMPHVGDVEISMPIEKMRGVIKNEEKMLFDRWRD